MFHLLSPPIRCKYLLAIYYLQQAKMTETKVIPILVLPSRAYSLVKKRILSNVSYCDTLGAHKEEGVLQTDMDGKDW